MNGEVSTSQSLSSSSSFSKHAIATIFPESKEIQQSKETKSAERVCSLSVCPSVLSREAVRRGEVKVVFAMVEYS